MSTLDAKPIKVKTLNPKMLTIAAILLIVLALLFLASPLLGLNGGFQRGTNSQRQFNAQNFPGGARGANGFPTLVPGQTLPGGSNGFPGTGNGSQNQGGTNLPGRQFGNGTGLLGFGLLRGVASTIVYGVALLISLAAAIGMLSVKRWGKVLGIVIAVIYTVLAVISFLPTLLFIRFIGSNPLNLILSVLHVVLAIAVIVFASIPAKKESLPAEGITPPPATA
jgi:hypothetical protein